MSRKIFTVERSKDNHLFKRYHKMYVIGDTDGGGGDKPIGGDVTWGDINGDIDRATAQQIEDATKDITATLSNKTINAEYNTISNLETEDFKSSALATSSNNVRTYDNSVDTKVVTEKFLQKTLHNIELPDADKDAANKKYVDDLITELNGKILKFKGFISITAPTGSIKNGNLWYESNILPSAFPINVKTYNETTRQWSATTSQYTPESLDLWANLNDDKGYYWFGNGWNMIDDNGRFLYVSTFTGVIGNPQVLYYLDTAYSTYEKGFYRFIPASEGNQEKFVLLNKELFKYVSTFTGVTGDVDKLYFLDTEYNSYKVGFYRFIEAQGSEPAKFVRINPSPIKYVSTFNGVVGNIEDLYYLDTEYGNHEVGFYRFVEATATEPQKFVLLNKQRFKYVSTFTGEIGDINRLYYLDTAYDTYKVGFYRFIPAVGAEPAKFVLIGRPPVKYVSTFNNVVGDTDVLYYLDTKYGDYKIGFYRYIEAQGATPAKFLLIGSASEVFTDVGVNESLPTTDIDANTIYRKATYEYLHSGEKLESEPTGYKIADIENISVSATGITIDGTEILWEDLTDTIVSGLVTAERLTDADFTEADFFNYNITLFDTASNFERETVYILYYNPTGQEGEYIKIGGEGGSVDVEIDNTTITKVNDKLQANAILEVDTLPTTNIKEKSVYKIVDKVPEYIDKYYYNGSTTPMNQTPNMYKGDGEHVTFTTTGATINGNSVAYIAITAAQIALYEAQGWVLNVDYDEAEALHVSGDTFDSITKLDKQVETAYHNMVKYYYREDGNWVNHSVVNLTQDLYDNLSTEQKTDGTIYVVDDATPVIQGFTYDELANKPSINGITLQDALSLEDLSLYSRSEVNALLENKGQVEFVNALPATPTTNTWYYSKKFEDGTDVPNDKRCLYIVDEDTTVFHDMGIVGDIEMETGDTLSGSEHLVTSSQVVKKETSTKINKYGTQVNVETAVDDATLWTMLAQIGTDDKKTDSSMVFNAGTCYLISSVSPTNTAQIYQFIVTGSVGASAINKRITLINPLTNEMFTKVMDGGTWQAWKGGKKYKHTLVRYNNDSFEYPMGWFSVINNKKTMTYNDFRDWLNTNGYTTATNSYYWCGGCCGTTGVRNSADTGTAYVGRVASGVFYDGTNMFFKYDYNGTVTILSSRCKVVTEELN